MNSHNNVRTFRAPTPRAALNAVKAALGAEAVILETREVRGRFFGRSEVEIIAASAEPNSPTLRENEDAATEALSELAKTRAAVTKAMSNTPTSDLDGEVQALRRVVDDLRRDLHATSGPKAEPRDMNELGATSMPPDALRLFRRLMQRGVEPTLAESVTRLALRDAGGGRRPDDLIDALRVHLRRRLASALPPWDADERKVLALVGPTGVGKTTTIAKIAARAMLERRLKVALVTVDTYRIGASEHINRYGEIMGVPVHVARDAAGLKKAIAACGDARLILVDTAGRSDSDSLNAQARLLQSVPAVETHLVLSAAGGGRELAAAAKRFRGYEASRFIFTKLDEADGPGGVLSASEVSTLPVSCLTDGQRVPDDLHAATGPRLAELVLGK